jgi:hypothetical protein
LFHLAATLVFWPCLAWVAFVHLVFLVTLEDDVGELWIAPLRGTPAIHLAITLLFIQYFITPLGLLAGVLVLRSRIRSPALFGLLAGLLLGLWADTEFLVITYCGGYTSLPGAMLGMVLSDGANEGPLYTVPVVVTNLVMWPFIGWGMSWVPPIREWLLQAPRPDRVRRVSGPAFRNVSPSARLPDWRITGGKGPENRRDEGITRGS